MLRIVAVITSEHRPASLDADGILVPSSTIQGVHVEAALEGGRHAHFVVNHSEVAGARTAAIFAASASGSIEIMTPIASSTKASLAESLVTIERDADKLEALAQTWRDKLSLHRERARAAAEREHEA